jgi:hypothetical protein
MRSGQLRMRFTDERELGQVWRQLSPNDQVSIARSYARLLIKAAKVVVPGGNKKGRNEHER